MIEPRLRLLIVDDDARTLRVYRRLLSQAFVVSTASTTSSALSRIVDGEVFDVIVCDRNFESGMGGEAFLEELGRLSPALQERVVICSAQIPLPEDLFAAVLGDRYFFKLDDVAKLIALATRLGEAPPTTRAAA